MRMNHAYFTSRYKSPVVRGTQHASFLSVIEDVSRDQSIGLLAKSSARLFATFDRSSPTFYLGQQTRQNRTPLNELSGRRLNRQASGTRPPRALATSSPSVLEKRQLPAIAHFLVAHFLIAADSTATMARK